MQCYNINEIAQNYEIAQKYAEASLGIGLHQECPRADSIIPNDEVRCWLIIIGYTGLQFRLIEDSGTGHGTNTSTIIPQEFVLMNIYQSHQCQREEAFVVVIQ